MITLTEPFRIQTPAKINLFLYIQKKRDDGYHELLMDLIPVSFFDEIHFSPANDHTIQITSNSGEIANQNNLVVKAIQLLSHEINEQISICAQLNKSIPIGAGLGGGSGNAAGTMVALNQKLKLGIKTDRLKILAKSIGADVPFFITPQPAIAKGIGEQLSPISDFKPFHVIIIFPNYSIATKTAYANCYISGRRDGIPDYSLKTLRTLDLTLMNDFWQTLAKDHSFLGVGKTLASHTDPVAFGLSGSGSAMYAIYETAGKQQHALQYFKNNTRWSLYPCLTMRSYAYLPESPKTESC